MRVQILVLVLFGDAWTVASTTYDYDQVLRLPTTTTYRLRQTITKRRTSTDDDYFGYYPHPSNQHRAQNEPRLSAALLDAHTHVEPLSTGIACLGTLRGCASAPWCPPAA